MSSEGNLIILSAPSGSGKTSLASRLIEQVDHLTFSVSYTTRSKRKGEEHGVEYFFVSESQFEDMIAREAFLEWAHVYGNYYGTERLYVESQQQRGLDVLLDIDVQGALKIKEQVPDAVMIFVLPPSYDVLSQRLKERDLDHDSVIESRLAIARKEVTYFDRYQYVIINREIDGSVRELEAIVLADRSRVDRRLDRAREIVKSFALGD